VTEYTFNPPTTVEARQFVGNLTDRQDIGSWVESNLITLGEATPTVDVIPFMNAMNIETSTRVMLVENEDYVFFTAGNVHKMSKQTFELFFSNGL
jgi:hypothetical protein